MRSPIVDVTADSGDEGGVAEVVDISDAEGDVDDGGVSEVSSTNEPPAVFRGYRRGPELGRGASGKVFVCSKKGSPTGFAVKIVDLRRIELSSNAEREQKKLRREVDILKKLPPHKCVVQLVDAFEQGHWMFFVLELVGGGDLFTVLTARAQPRLLDREAAFVLRQMVEGLRFLHGQGIIHRDLKLENVLVASERRQRPLVFYSIKITDFGLSKSVGAGHSEARSTVGTRPYTAPEVLREGLHDHSSDLWCLGVLLFVLLAGRFPFDHIASQQADLDKIVFQVKATDQAKKMLGGFLRLEPSERTGLEVVMGDPWLLVDEPPPTARPAKRLRTGSRSIIPASPIMRPAPQAGADVPELALLESSGQGTARSSTDVASTVPEPLPEPPPSKEGLVAGNHQALAAQQAEIVERFNEEEEKAYRHLGSTLNAAPDEVAALPSVGTNPPGPGGSEAEADIHGFKIPIGAWTPFAVEDTVRVSEVQPPSEHPDVMQVHVVVPDRHAGFVLGKSGSRIQETAATAGCKVWMTSRKGTSDRSVIIIGTYKQCKIAQELIHEQLANALNADWRDTESEALLLIRAEAAGVVIGKQGFVLDHIRKHSGAKIQLLRQEVEGQRPCIVAGTLQNVLRAQRLVFHLVSCVNVAQVSAESSSEREPADAPFVGPANLGEASRGGP